MSRGDRPGRIRLVVFTAGPLTAVNRVFFEGLARDPLLELSAIVVDKYARPRKSLAVRVVHALRQDGPAWLAFKMYSELRWLLQRTTSWVFERAHAPRAQEESYETLGRRTRVRIHQVPDMNGEVSVAMIRSLRPHLGIIVGTHILRAAVLTIPEHGTLTIRKGKMAESGGPVGYREILAGESSIGVAVHHATARGAAAPVLAQATIPIEACDTLESLRIKTDLLGARLYHDAIRRFALGMRRGVGQWLSGDAIDRAPSELSVSRLERRLRRRAAAAMPLLRGRPRWPVRVRVFGEYVSLLPALLAARNRLIRQHQAPICIIFYHLVANHGANHMCLPLEEFVRQMEFLRRYYTLLSLPEAVERVRSGKNDRIAVAITFDDGYRDNVWALEYLRYFEIPACFFVSVGHVLDGTAFEHDRRRGFEAAGPMAVADLRQLAADGFVVGSHGVYHEDFGRIAPAAAERVLCESREMIAQICGETPEHFSFPKGHPENTSVDSFRLATKYYPYVYSAYGGYCFPQIGRRHFPRTGHPLSLLELAMVMDGYTGFRACLTGNVWGLKLDGVGPNSADAHAAVASPVA